MRKSSLATWSEGQSRRRQFRWETFNTWNHTQFGSANLNTSSPTFGRITSTRVGPRRMQFGLRVMF
jgi:hypothetical protein